MLKGKEIFLSSKIKYLGVILDRRLNMNEHVEYIKNKANKTLWAANSRCKRNWGLQPKKMHYIYSSIALPRVTYGSFGIKFKITVEIENEYHS